MGLDSSILFLLQAHITDRRWKTHLKMIILMRGRFLGNWLLEMNPKVSLNNSKFLIAILTNGAIQEAIWSATLQRIVILLLLLVRNIFRTQIIWLIVRMETLTPLVFQDAVMT